MSFIKDRLINCCSCGDLVTRDESYPCQDKTGINTNFGDSFICKTCLGGQINEQEHTG